MRSWLPFIVIIALVIVGGGTVSGWKVNRSGAATSRANAAARSCARGQDRWMQSHSRRCPRVSRAATWAPRTESSAGVTVPRRARRGERPAASHRRRPRRAPRGRHPVGRSVGSVGRSQRPSREVSSRIVAGPGATGCDIADWGLVVRGDTGPRTVSSDGVSRARSSSRRECGDLTSARATQPRLGTQRLKTGAAHLRGGLHRRADAQIEGLVRGLAGVVGVDVHLQRGGHPGQGAVEQGEVVQCLRQR